MDLSFHSFLCICCLYLKYYLNPSIFHVMLKIHKSAGMQDP